MSITETLTQAVDDPYFGELVPSCRASQEPAQSVSLKVQLPAEGDNDELKNFALSTDCTRISDMDTRPEGRLGLPIYQAALESEKVEVEMFPQMAPIHKLLRRQLFILWKIPVLDGFFDHPSGHIHPQKRCYPNHTVHQGNSES